MVDYCAQAKRSYLIAAEIPTAPDTPAPGAVLERLSDKFELCVYGLGEVRRQWLAPDDNPADGPFIL